MEQAELSVPPEVLRFKVHGPGDVEDFLAVGRRCHDDIVAALSRNGVALSGCSTVLDFGCGCGRTLRWFADLASSVAFHGTDVDAEAVDWCRQHLAFGTFDVNDRFPPLRYQDGFFDVVYLASVLTHLDEPDQFAWLDELNRITRPGGTVLATLHGADLTSVLPPELVAKFHARGFLFVDCNFMDDLFPSWYQLTYHSEEYVRREFSRCFTVCEYIPKGLDDYQDIVVLRK